jgi:hypothetical protein
VPIQGLTFTNAAGQTEIQHLRGTPCIVFLPEFAYEIMWAGVARKMKESCGHIAVLTRPDRFAFHADYADAIFAHNIKCVSAGCWATKETAPTREAIAACIPEGYAFVRPHDHGRSYRQRGKYIVYGRQLPEWQGAIVLHARERAYCQNRDWTRENWNQVGRWLASEFPRNKIVCIGSLAESHAIEGCADLRGIPLQDVMNVLRSANVFIGQSSGPAHLSSHCGCPHIIWCEPGIEELYRVHWNPHNTWVRTRCFAGDPHKPSYEAVRDYVMESLGELRKAAA